MFFRRCPQCGGEYQYTVSVCADCGCALEDAPAVQHLDSTPLPDASQLVGLRTDHPWAVEELAVALQRAGIPSRIDTNPPGTALGGPAYRREGYSGAAIHLAVYVREQDYEAAQRVDAEVFASRTPDAAVPDAASGSEAAACPGCGTPLSSSAASCAECGLEFPEA